ncbi:hypothetical protein VTI74DRAFT_4989 [Chaetomium olivicolor]
MTVTQQDLGMLSKVRYRRKLIRHIWLRNTEIVEKMLRDLFSMLGYWDHLDNRRGRNTAYPQTQHPFAQRPRALFRGPTWSIIATFFAACRENWSWPELRSLALVSRYLYPGNSVELANMLCEAGRVV